MLEKLLGVSPPQKGLAQDSKVVDKKNLPPDFKKDFERQLQKKLDQKSTSSKENEKDPKAQAAKKSEDELRAERNEKKPSGGTKKKMVDSESEVTMISNVMALPESEFEISDQKIDLTMIETEGNSEEAKINVNVDGTAEKAAVAVPVVQNTAGDAAPKISNQEFVAASAVENSEVEADVSTLLQALQQQQEPTIAAKLNPVSPEASAVEPAAVEAAAPAAAAAVAEQPSFEDLLGQDVGFQSDLRQHVASNGLIQKMKEFESDKGMSAETAMNFEQKVLEQLTQEKIYTVPNSDMAKDSSSDRQSENPNESLKELKADSFKPDSSLHMGQSHTDFKAHMSTPLEKTGTATALSQLLERRDENVQEVMKQAQFLATKGGGEMTVRMSPDGMGEIQLKVLMQDGRLNIEMQTQDKSVKKLIEDSITELKSGLAAQQLSVDHVRISTVNATNTENSTQFQPGQNHSGQNFSAGQDQQKEFWKQFQNNFGNQARRGSYGDVQSVSGARTTAEPNALQPLQTGKARATGRTGSTLNRVA